MGTVSTSRVDVIRPRTFHPPEQPADPLDVVAAHLVPGEGQRIGFLKFADAMHDPHGLFGQVDTHGAAVVGRALLFYIPHFDQLLDVVGDFRALVVTAFHQVADDDLLLSDIGEKQGLNRIDVLDGHPVEVGSEHIEKTPVQAFNEAR